MYYYQILPADQSYQKNDPLTYASKAELAIFDVVEISIKNKRSPGLVVGTAPKPQSFKAKPIEKPLNITLSKRHYRLLKWLTVYYPASLGSTVSLFLPSYVLRTTKRINSVNTPAGELPGLTTQQSTVYQNIINSDQLLHMVHGITGSGKTRLYTELINNTLASKKSCIVLVPEIGLSPQMQTFLSAGVAAPVIVMHSKMTPKQKATAYYQIISNEPCVVIGPRSAVFSPVHNLGLIVMDECHDRSYKQEQAPYYLASRVVAKMAHIWQCKAVFGSATPPVADYYVFNQKQLPIHTLDQLAKKHSFTRSLQLIDRKERQLFSSSRLFAKPVIDAIKNNIAHNEQTLLFLNRRGSARIVMCNKCSWHALCPHCDINVTLHSDEHAIRCHSCGHTASPPTTCPECNNHDVVYTVAGTKTVETEIKKLFPSANVARFDADNKKADSLASQYDSVRSGGANIIIGTQIITKGLDLPLLKTVIVTSAEGEVNFPDFSARESAFQQLSQIIGRTHRGHRNSEVFIQTLNPNSQLIKDVIRADYQSFYNRELSERKQFNFPPFRYILVLKVRRKTLKGVEKASQALHKSLTYNYPELDVSPAYPSFREKQAGYFRWQIVVRSTNRTKLVQILHKLPANTQYDIDPLSLL